MNATRSEFYTSASKDPDNMFRDTDTLDKVMALYNIISVQDYTDVTIVGYDVPEFLVKFTTPEQSNRVMLIINNQDTIIYGRNIHIECVPTANRDELLVRMNII